MPHITDVTAVALVVFAALCCGGIFARLKQPAIVGYIVAGALLGPAGLELVSNRSTIDTLADFGALMLLFVVGMQLDLHGFVSRWKVAVIATLLQIDQGADSDRYQGIVELSGNSLAECAERYFEKSEQLDTAVMASVQAPSAAQPGWRAAVLMVQRMPAAEQAPIFTAEQSEEIWRRAKVLHASLRTGELFDEHLTADKLLYRLFHADGLVSFTPRPIHAECRCSPERVATVLRSFPADEIAAMRDERGHIEIVCEFCKTAYSFTQDNDGQIHLLDSSTVF